MTSLCSEYLIGSEHSLATHGRSMMMVVAEDVADRFHSVLRLLRNQIKGSSQNIGEQNIRKGTKLDSDQAKFDEQLAANDHVREAMRGLWLSSSDNCGFSLPQSKLVNGK